MNKTALITGFTGQDGTFLAKHLLENGYRVIGLVRRISTEPPHRIRGQFDFSSYMPSGQLVLEPGDLLSPASLNKIVSKYQPHEIYNLAAQSHVGISFNQPEFTIDSILDGTINLINALQSCHKGSWHMYQASTSEMYGDVLKMPTGGINEKYPLNPNSPYAIAKAAAHQYCKMKRAQGCFISCGILFNHESEIRGGDFVTQKIVRGVWEWQRTAHPIHLGNLDAQRDWGYAGDYVKAMHLMLQQGEADDFVIATGESHSIREFVDAALHQVGQSADWQHKYTIDECAWVNKTLAVVVDPKFYRPNDVNYLIGDASKAKEILGWEPEHKFDLIVKIMVEAAK